MMKSVLDGTRKAPLEAGAGGVALWLNPKKSSPTPSGRPRAKAFTLVEVMLAMLILAFGILSTFATITIAVSQLDLARMSDVAGQVMQNEVERIRLLNWTSVDGLPATQVLDLTASSFGSNVMVSRLTVTRTVAAANGGTSTTMKEITLTSTWKAVNGTARTKTFKMHYARYGLYDYYYSTN